ncbi:MAG TPA: hypothetical protein VL242_37445 [Sorangium sp.]|nr:hypothetical protein [Sorangium sp.]
MAGPGGWYETQCENPVGAPARCLCIDDGVKLGTCYTDEVVACGVTESCCLGTYLDLL